MNHRTLRVRQQRGTLLDGYDVTGNRTQVRYPDAKNVNYVDTSGGQSSLVADHGNVTIADYAE
jgi:hypothetical protein